VQESAVNDELSAVEGWGDVKGTISLTRSPFFGAEDLIRVLDEDAVTNGASGNVFSLGDVFGDLAAEGQLINLVLAKPASGTASGVIVATVASRSNLAIASALSGIANTTTGSAFAALSTFDVGAIRRLSGVALHILARVTSITAPTKAQLAVEVQTAGGVVLWRSSWVRLGSDTTGQIVDMGAATLDMLRIPLPASTAANIKLVGYLRSSDGTTVAATLDYFDALLAYDFCVVESAGLASDESLVCYGAQNLSEGRWLPLPCEVATVLDGSNIQTKPARIRGTLVRAFTGQE